MDPDQWFQGHFEASGWENPPNLGVPQFWHPHELEILKQELESSHLKGMSFECSSPSLQNTNHWVGVDPMVFLVFWCLTTKNGRMKTRNDYPLVGPLVLVPMPLLCYSHPGWCRQKISYIPHLRWWHIYRHIHYICSIPHYKTPCSMVQSQCFGWLPCLQHDGPAQ